jgi:hypothetical protein
MNVYVCVCVLALIIWYAKCIFSVIYGLFGCIIFSTLSDDFSEKELLSINCVVQFSLQLYLKYHSKKHLVRYYLKYT